MFGDDDYGLGPAPPVPTLVSSTGDPVITVDAAPGATSRNTAELNASIKKAGGALAVYPNSSAYIVAVNNGLHYSVTKLSDGTYRITESQMPLYLIVGAVILGVVLLSRG